MQGLLAQLQQYLHENLGIGITLAPWAGGSRLPLYLRDRYRFFHAQLLGTACLFVIDQARAAEPPAAVRKHLDQVRVKWSDATVYVRGQVTAYNRKRLIEQKVPFIVPGNQMYLPMLGIDLRERFRPTRPDRQPFSPSAQAVLIWTLLHRAPALNPSDLATKLGYTAMTMGRALSELEAADLAESSLSGRQRDVRLKVSGRAAWQKAQEFLRTPVVGRYPLHVTRGESLPGPRSGLTALAHYSSLSEPAGVVVAVSRKVWRSLASHDRTMTVHKPEPDAPTVEVWSYDPTLLAEDAAVDPLSLYLSLSQETDERVQAALGQMLEDVQW
jgi:DNA-binding MarR family transcriptional regulator